MLAEAINIETVTRETTCRQWDGASKTCGHCRRTSCSADGQRSGCWHVTSSATSDHHCTYDNTKIIISISISSSSEVKAQKSPRDTHPWAMGHHLLHGITVLPATRHKWKHPTLTPASKLVLAGTRYSSQPSIPRGMEGWDDLGQESLYLNHKSDTPTTTLAAAAPTSTCFCWSGPFFSNYLHMTSPWK